MEVAIRVALTFGLVFSFQHGIVAPNGTRQKGVRLVGGVCQSLSAAPFRRFEFHLCPLWVEDTITLTRRILP